MQRDFSTALQKKDEAGFYHNVWRFIWILVIAVPVFSCKSYIRQRLALGWRRWLTDKFLTAYFDKRAYLELQHQGGKVDNPDQRISQDVALFSDNATTLAETCFSSVLQVGSFSGVLYSISPGLFGILVIYCFCGTVVTTAIFGPTLVRLNFDVLQKEADFRFSLVRVRENAESIAFYRGEDREQEHCQTNFEALVAVLLRTLKWQFGLNGWLSIYDYITLLVPSLVIAPRFFRGEVEFGVIAQSGMAFRAVYGGLSLLLMRFNDMTTLGAQLKRLNELMAAIQVDVGDGDSDYQRVSPEDRDDEGQDKNPLLHDDPAEKVQCYQGTSLSLKELSFHIPSSKQRLVESLSLELAAGDSLLIMGGSGSGKSSLLRVIAGLWQEGSGSVTRQADRDVLFVPQASYMLNLIPHFSILILTLALNLFLCLRYLTCRLETSERSCSSPGALPSLFLPDIVTL